MSDLKLSFKLAVDTAAAAPSVSGFTAKTKSEINSIEACYANCAEQLESLLDADHEPE